MGVYVATKTVLSLLLFAWMFSFAGIGESLDTPFLSAFALAFAVAVSVLDIKLWVLNAIREYSKKNGTKPTFLACNVALVLLVCGFFIFVSFASAETMQSNKSCSGGTSLIAGC